MIDVNVYGRDVADAAVEDGREAAVAYRLPDRVVVVLAVEPEGVEPVRLAGHQERRPRFGIGLRDRPGDALREPDHLQPELAAVGELGDRLLGRDHRHDPGDRHPVGERPVGVGEEIVQAAAQPDAHVLVLNPSSTKGFGRVEHAEVDAQLWQPLVQQRRDRGRRQVDRLGSRDCPTRRSAAPGSARVRRARCRP